MSTIRIVRAVDVYVRGVRHPFRSQYRLENSGVFCDVPGRGSVEIDYQGTPVAELRRIAARLGREQGRPVEDLTKSAVKRRTA